jgi:hypothetical protein
MVLLNENSTRLGGGDGDHSSNPALGLVIVVIVDIAAIGSHTPIEYDKQPDASNLRL